MRKMRIYNTLTRTREELVTIKKGELKMYACGPTVYNYFHIGNARPLCVFDVLRRYMEYRGYKVTFVQNFTDIDDKIIKRANEDGALFNEISEKFIDEYWIDAKGLNIREATFHPKATENIEEIIDIISTLINKGYAYEVEGDVYFSPSKFSDYGKLSHQPLEDLESGARIMVGEVKREPMDFALWKAAKPEEPYWASPWGNGRPGWHIECSAMVRRYLGETIDIHCGGQDLIFPHHENEIAQSECCNSVPFANYWMHNGYINVDNQKMSKSLGNFFTVRDVAEKFGYEPIRYMMISSHYSSPINYSYDIIEQSKASLNRLYNCRENLEFAYKNAPETSGSNNEDLLSLLNKRREQFIEAMDDDLNTADGLAAIFELVRDINTKVIDANADRIICEAAINIFDELCDVLGILYNRNTDSLDAKVEALIKARTDARQMKNWAEADRIRDELKAIGVIIEDTPQGVKWHKEV
jgi:cysteinyl-tRNA synthetase